MNHKAVYRLHPRYVWFMFDSCDTAGLRVGCGDKQLDRDTFYMMLMGGEL